MTARNRFFIILSFGVVVTVISLVALYGREELLARESALAQSESVAGATAAIADPEIARAAAHGDFSAVSRLNSQLVRIQLSNPRIRQMVIYVPEGSGNTFRVAAEIGPVNERMRPGTAIEITEDAPRIAFASGQSASTWSDHLATTWSPIQKAGASQGLLRVEYDATGIGTGIFPVLVVLALGLLLTLVLVVFVSRNIGKRLQLLVDGTARLAEGDLAHRVEVKGHDEIAELAASFNKMADALEENRKSLGNAIAELGRASALVEARASENEMLLRRTVEAVDDERRRLATELHDSTIQSLQSIGMLAEYVAMLISRERYEDARERLDILRNRLDNAIADLRRLLFDLRPPNLDDTGLAAALRSRLSEVSELANLKTSLEIAESLEIPRELETVIYRFCQEALSNVVRHADASSVEIRVWRQNDTLRVSVEDNGKGFNTNAIIETGHFGIQGMKERAELAGGTLQIDSRLGLNTRVELALPIGSRGKR